MIKIADIVYIVIGAFCGFLSFTATLILALIGYKKYKMKLNHEKTENEKNRNHEKTENEKNRNHEKEMMILNKADTQEIINYLKETSCTNVLKYSNKKLYKKWLSLRKKKVSNNDR